MVEISEKVDISEIVEISEIAEISEIVEIYTRGRHRDKHLETDT